MHVIYKEKSTPWVHKFGSGGKKGEEGARNNGINVSENFWTPGKPSSPEAHWIRPVFCGVVLWLGHQVQPSILSTPKDSRPQVLPYTPREDLFQSAQEGQKNWVHILFGGHVIHEKIWEDLSPEGWVQTR